MKQLLIKTRNSHVSTVSIGTGLMDAIPDILGDLSIWSSIHIFYDKNVEELAHSISKSLDNTHLIPISEPEINKSFSGVETAIKALHETKADRHSLVVNVGGGALGDCGGFAASIYMRGLPFVNVPTTLLAQVDASIGGKTGINACGIKNLVGTFTQPLHVIIDPQALVNLPENHFASGCAEMLKHGLISDADYWLELKDHTTSSLRENMATLEAAITRSCEIKHSIVSSDEHENGERKKLNFGHTVGHAIEAQSHTTSEPYLHGEAIALGMIVEAKMSKVSDQDRTDIAQTLRSYGLPTKIRSGLDINSLISLMHADKKNVGGEIKWTLLDAVGVASYDQKRDEALLREALKEIMI